MLYQKRSFTVPATGGNGSMCAEKGHSATDSKGRCLCCGEKIDVAQGSAIERPTIESEGPGHPSILDTANAFVQLRGR